MTDFIRVSVVPINTLFSGSYRFRLPWFQRAYAWTTDHVGPLLTNIFELLDEQDEARKRYFLGNLMIARPNGQLDTALVDGHQRVMTLTLMFAVIRDLETDPVKRAEIQSLIGTVSNTLQPQVNLAEFCATYVQTMGATEIEPADDMETLTETEANIIENRNYLREQLSDDEVSVEVRRELLSTLINKCFVIVQEVVDEDEAWRMLKVVEDTKHDFNPANHAKASLLSMVAPHERAACRLIWEDCEALLGSDDFYRLLGYLRIMKIRRRSEMPFESEIGDAYGINNNGLGFFRDIVAPAAKRLAAIRRKEIGGGPRREAISKSLKLLSWIVDDRWAPAALLWLERRGDSAEGELFFSRLDRLMWIMRIAGIDPDRQQRRIVGILNEIDKGVAAGNMRDFEISASMRNNALSNLRSLSFDQKSYATRVLRRLSADMGEDPGSVQDNDVTLEHILPRSFKPDWQWSTIFKSEKNVREHAHRLGNLTFLTAKENNELDNSGWPVKRAAYANFTHLMTRQLVTYEHWNADVINERTEALIERLFKSWELPYEPIGRRRVTPRFN